MKEEIMNQTNIKIGQLRDRMKELGIDAYLVPTADFHESEYVGEFFKCRHFLTGFNGTAGTAVITMDKAGLWTDGRYFVQAEEQLSGSEIKLYRMGEPEFPTLDEFLEEELPVDESVLYFSSWHHEDLKVSLRCSFRHILHPGSR